MGKVRVIIEHGFVATAFEPAHGDGRSQDGALGNYSRLLNLRLDVVVKDTCGLTGLTIIRATCEGEKDPDKLASLRHYNCERSEEEIAKALQSNPMAGKITCSPLNTNSRFTTTCKVR